MLPGLRTDSAADPFGWRVANYLAIAAPYLLAAVLFAVLYLQPTEPAAQTAPARAPNPASDGVAPAEPVASAAAAPVAAPSTVPMPAKSAAPPVPAAPPARSAAKPGATAAASPATAPAAAAQEALPAAPVPVEPDVAETMKLPGDTVGYPPAAQAAHIQGVVVLAATIGRDGSVQTVEAVSGPALLEVGAIGAVRSWRYRPWLVQGRAVPFSTHIIINFEIGGAPQ